MNAIRGFLSRLEDPFEGEGQVWPVVYSADSFSLRLFVRVATQQQATCLGYGTTS